MLDGKSFQLLDMLFQISMWNQWRTCYVKFWEEPDQSHPLNIILTPISNWEAFCFYMNFKLHVHSFNQVLLATSAARCLIISITAALRRDSIWCCNLRKCSFKSLQRGTRQSASLQARACNCKRYHIFLQRWQPPEARTLHCIPCRNSPFTFRQFGYWQIEEQHWEACTRRSNIVRNWSTLCCRASLFCASRSAMDGWVVSLWGWDALPSFW